MALNVGSLYGVLELDAKPFEKTLDTATRKGQKDLADGLNNLARQAAFGFGLGFVGFKLESAFRDVIGEAREAEKATALTQQVIRSTGGVAGVSARDVDKLALSLSKVAGVDDEVIQNGERLLLTFLHIRNEAGKGNDIFDQAVKAAVDMSAALGTDLQSSIIGIGKALNEPATGALALSRNGSLARSDLHKLQEMMKAGTPLIEQQRFILQKLSEQYSGAAAAGATAGDKLHVSIGNLKESFGQGLVPAVDVADKGLGALADGFTALPGPIRTTTSVLTTGAIAAVAAQLAYTKLAEALAGTTLAGLASRAGLGGLIGLAPQIIGVGAVATATFLTLRSVFGDNNESWKKGANEMKIAFTQTAGALTEVSAAAIASDLHASGSFDKLAKAGFTVADVFRAASKPQKEAFHDLAEIGRQAGLTGGQIQHLGAIYYALHGGSKEAKLLAGFFGDITTGEEEAAAAAEKLAAAYEKRVAAAFDAHISGLVATLQAAQGVTSAESSLSDAISGAGDEASSSASKMKTYADAVSQVFDSVLAADRAHTAASQSIKKLTETNKEFTGDAIARLQGLIRLDGKQVASQDDLHSALLDVIEAREREVDAMANSGEIANTAQARHQALVDSLLDLRNQYPGLAGDIDRYLDAAKKIPELPLEAAIDKVAHKQDDMADATLGVVSALEQQAKADDDPIHGLESMNTQLDALMKKYKDFPAVKDVFAKALAESILTEAQILAGQMSLPADLIAGILSLPSGDRTSAFAGLFGLSYDPPGRASGGPVAAGMPYLTGENGPEWFVPSTPGTILPYGQGLGGDSYTAHIYAPQADGDYLARRAVFEMQVLSMSRR